MEDLCWTISIGITTFAVGITILMVSLGRIASKIEDFNATNERRAIQQNLFEQNLLTLVRQTRDHFSNLYDRASDRGDK